jgi:hypothetical protein
MEVVNVGECRTFRRKQGGNNWNNWTIDDSSVGLRRLYIQEVCNITGENNVQRRGENAREERMPMGLLYRGTTMTPSETKKKIIELIRKGTRLVGEKVRRRKVS